MNSIPRQACRGQRRTTVPADAVTGRGVLPGQVVQTGSPVTIVFS